MRVIVWPAGGDNDATSQYRVVLPALALRAQGCDVEIDHRGPQCTFLRGDGDEAGDEMISVERPPADVVVLQRQAQQHWARVIPLLQAKGVRVVYDLDDRFDMIDRSNRAHRGYDPAHSPHANHDWIDEACRAADLVTATTPALIRRYGHGHGQVLSNLIPERYLSIEPKLKRSATVGWTGSVETHPGDLEVTCGAVERAFGGTHWRVHVVGSGNGVQEALGLSREPTTSHGWVPFAEYPARMAEPTVGIVPLKPSLFNESKSALKMGEFASLGVPVIASPTPDNHRLHEMGVGLIAAKPAHWDQQLRKLITSRGMREHLSGSGREVMATQTYERLAERWWDAWASIRQLERTA